MGKPIVRGIIGITDEGQPIVTADHRCPHFAQYAGQPIGVRECWHCKFADFSKNSEAVLHQSICLCPQNRVNVVSEGKNELYQQPSPLIEKFVSNIKGGVITCVWDAKTKTSRAVYLNEGWTAITGYTLEELNSAVAGNPQALVYLEDKAAADLEYSRQTQRSNEYALLYRVIRKGGSTIWVIDRGVVSVLPNGDIQNQSIVTEVTELKEQEQHLQRLAQLDQLTGTYNKVTFAQQTQMILAQQCDKLHAIIMLDIDNFKTINDSRGHAYGDKVLGAVADCLKLLFRNRDLIGRIGGDEFMVLMTDVLSREIAARKVDTLCAAIHSIAISEGEPLSVSVSMGITFSDGSEDYEEIFKRADSALYAAKRSGKNQYRFFERGSGCGDLPR